MADDSDDLRAKLTFEGALLVAVKVTPRAATSEVVGLADDGTLRARIAALPEKGKANEELRSLLSRYFGVPKGNVVIVSGASSAHKRVRITA
jgi:uncharacterized protein (TIGR00251 family)